MLRDVGLRPTRQRMALGWILFAKGDRHLTAEMLYEEATKAKVPVSLATVYNTLHQFTDVGLLRQVAVDGSKTYFDTNTTAHHHFFVEGDNALVDIPGAEEIVEQDPGRSGRLRDRPHRRGGPPAPQGQVIRDASSRRWPGSCPAFLFLHATSTHPASCPGLSRASTSCLRLDGRASPAMTPWPWHDDMRLDCRRRNSWTNPPSTNSHRHSCARGGPASASTRCRQHLKPKNFADSCAVMDAVDRLVGERIVGTKIAAKPGAEVVYAPLPAGRVFTSPARVPRALTPSQYMECEISFRLTRDLPARQDEYSEARGVRRAGSLRRVRAGGQPLPRSEVGDGQHALRILRRPHRQRRHGVRTLPQATGRSSISPRPACR